MQKLPILSISEAFVERIRQTAGNVEELMKIAEALQTKEDEVDVYMEKAFDTIGIFDENRKIQSTAVNVTRNLTEKRMSELNDIKMVVESTRLLVTSTYHILSKTVKNQTDQLRNSLYLLRDWATALYETEKQSKNKRTTLTAPRIQSMMTWRLLCTLQRKRRQTPWLSLQHLIHS